MQRWSNDNFGHFACQIWFRLCCLNTTSAIESQTTAFSHFVDIVIFRVWPLQSASCLRSTSCALCVEKSSPAQWPYHVDTASACPVSATTGHDTSPNTAPTVRECLLTGLTSVSTAFWQTSQTSTGGLDHRNHLMRKWYFIAIVNYLFVGDMIW